VDAHRAAHFGIGQDPGCSEAPRAGEMIARVALAKPGITFDTGALIALERRRDAMRKVYAAAIAAGFVITVPTVVITEWWRAGHREKERLVILRSVRLEPLFEQVARIAGAALGLTRGAGAIDAIVMASAALRGDTVYTSDPHDLAALQRANRGFAAVQIVRC
jgi:predicted nucleic acid-binding protein